MEESRKKRTAKLNPLEAMGFLTMCGALIACVTFIVYRPNISGSMNGPNTTCPLPIDVPQKWVDFLWVISYIWMALFLAYDCSTFFRAVLVEKQIFLYQITKCGNLSMITYVLLLLKSILTVIFFCYSPKNDYLGLTVICLVIAFLANINYIITAIRIRLCRNQLSDADRYHDVWFLKILGLNGMAFLASWTTFLGLFCFSVVLKQSSNALLSANHGLIFFVSYLIWTILDFLLEVIFFDAYFRHSVIYYFVVAITSASIILNCQRYYPEDWPRHYDLQLTLLGFGTAFFTLKLIILVVRDFRGFFPDNISIIN